MPKLIKQKADGYIVIIVLLLTAVLLMLGLSLATRTTEEVYQSGQEADTTRVFNAAETGIEEVLSKMQAGTVNFNTADTLSVADGELSEVTGANVDLTVKGEIVEDFDFTVKQGEVLTVPWNDTSNTTIKWTHNVNCSDAASIIVTAYVGSGSSAKAYHVAYNPSGTDADCVRGTGFDKATGSNGNSQVLLTSGAAGNFGVDLAASTTILRIRPLYNEATFNMEGSSATQLVATANDKTDDAGKETRKIQVIRTEPAPPSIFDYAVFSGGSLVKQ